MFICVRLPQLKFSAFYGVRENAAMVTKLETFVLN
jgi:hypothetical protein